MTHVAVTGASTAVGAALAREWGRRPREIYPSVYAFSRWLPPLARRVNDLAAPSMRSSSNRAS